MKKINILTCAMVALTMACTNNDEQQNVPNNYPEDNIIRVTAGVNNSMTRGSETGTTPYDGDFLLTVVNSANRKYTYANKQFTYTDATWNCNETLLWQNATTPVEIAAVAPYDDIYKVYDASDAASSPQKTFTYALHSDQTTQDAQNKNDLLYYYNSSFTPGTNLNSDGKLALTLNHAFCMFDIQVTLGTEFNTANGLTEDPIASATIKGIYNSADINVWGNPVVTVVTSETGPRGEITATPGDFTSVNNAEANATKKFSCIVLPQTLSKNNFSVTLLTTTGKKYEWSPASDITIESGKKYTLKLTMGDDKLVLKNGITANPWDSVDKGQLETD